jgi:hypothetical protein
MEAAAETDVAAGRTERFDSIDELLEDLDSNSSSA